MDGPPLALLRAISWRWVMNVVAPMITMRIAASAFVDVAEALSWSSACLLELNDAPIGTPNTLACAACAVSFSVRMPWKWDVYWPALLGCRLLSTLNSAKKTGIWTTIGRQPANGLVPASFQSAIISWLRRFLSFLYLACSSFIWGCSALIARWLLICLTNSGNSSRRIAMVSRTMDSAQAAPELAPKTGASPEWMWTISHAIAL